MNRAIKIIAYLAIASLLSYLANNGDREFIKGFSSNIISLLTTILAINIPTSTLIISETVSYTHLTLPTILLV